jgi:carboxypeptidase Taq
MQEKLQELKRHLLEISDLSSAYAVLNWDQSTYMPPQGATYRSRQQALLVRLAQERAVNPAIGRLLDDLRPHEESLPYEHDDAALIRVARRNYELAIKVPPAFVGRLVEHAGNTYVAWTQARPANDFKGIAPMLEKTLDLSREYAQHFPHDHLADPLIDQSDFGMKTEDIRRIFAELRRELVPIVQAISDQEPLDDSVLRRHYPKQPQLDFAYELAKAFGYDPQRGRLDLTAHPFMTKFSPGDVRITARVKEDDLGDALFSVLHEAGHALYELGIDTAYDGTPLNGGTSAGVHESQSRLWENVVGRSRGFWEHTYGDLQKVFPDQLGDVPLDVFYRAINKVQPSLIRTDADEVTYNLHVMIRFDLELDLLDGKLSIRDLPEAWHSRYQSDLGVRAPSDVDGALQDVHWYGGVIGGAFQGYTLGNIISLQFYEAALKANPHIPTEIAQGKFDTLRTWLTENVYSHGSKFTTADLLERVTGGPLTIAPYIRYLRSKYGELYSLPN